MVFCLGSLLTLNAQDGFTVTGVVVDDAGIPLPGASVVEQGTTNGVSTDFDGNYSIAIANQNASLVFSFIGYAEQEISVNGRSQINVTLITSASTLEEVVLVGYGSVKKKDLTGANFPIRCCGGGTSVHQFRNRCVAFQYGRCKYRVLLFSQGSLQYSDTGQ